MRLPGALRHVSKGPRLISQLIVRKLARVVYLDDLEFPIHPADLADSHTVRRPGPPIARDTDRPPSVAWLMIPPRRGSGGHTTLFRMVRAVADAGMRNTLLLYNRYGSDFDYDVRAIRESWPWLDCDIAPLGDSISGYDACVASAWPTAHVLANRRDDRVRPLYFIQDYEPFFTPRGSTYAFAEDSYRLGLRNLSLGPMVHNLLRDELGVDSDLIPYGLDTDTYRLAPRPGGRNGVAWYAKRGNDRRGHRHAERALQIFHAQHPDQPIHIYGDVISDAPFPAVNHGSLRPAELNELYNSVVAGLALSFTNVSLVPEEMLAAGAIPVVNDNPYARAVLDNPHVGWAQTTPAALAATLGAIVDSPERESRAAMAAMSVASRSWAPTGAAVVQAIAEEVGLSPMSLGAAA
jgi:hypothetical protein